jgi:predicted transcriptional regulator
VLRFIKTGVSKGPAATFNEFDAIECILLVGKSGEIGRNRLSKSLGLGGGAIRTLILRLKKAGFVRTTRTGCVLTKKGKRVFETLSSKLVFYASVNCWDERLSASCYALCLRGVDLERVKVVELRDKAVRAGARGALILEYRAGELFYAKESVSCEATQPSTLWGYLKSVAKLSERDIVVVSFAESERLARDGAFAVALALIQLDGAS